MQRHKIPIRRGSSVPESPGFTAIEEIGRYQLDEDKRYVHKSWTNDSKRLKKNIPAAADLAIESIDLNAGYDDCKIDVSFGINDIKMFHALLEWIYVKAYDLKANNVQVVANSSAIAELLQSSYGPSPNTDNLTVLATKNNGILYMMRYYHDNRESYHPYKYRSQRFRDFLVHDQSVDTNSNESGRYNKWLVNKTSFGGLNMLYTAHIAAVDSKDNFVSLHTMPENIYGTQICWPRLIRHWSIAVTAGASKMMIGLTEKSKYNYPRGNFLKRIETLVVNEIPEMVKNSTPEGRNIPWEPRICYRTLEAVIDTLLGLMIDDPKVLYQVQFGEPNESGNHNHLMVSQIPSPEFFDFIPVWYP